MDSEKRIEELETQVHRLTNLVSLLLDEREAAGLADRNALSEEARRLSTTVRAYTVEQPLVRDMRERVDRALRVDSDETIEGRIGAVWLSWGAVVLTMTFIALAARATFWADSIGPLQKTLIGYAVAFAFLTYGLFFRRVRDFFSQVILGCGLAGLYFTTYGAFYIDQMQVFRGLILGFPSVVLGLPLLMGCLAFLALVAHRRKSETAAGFGLFLAFYTVVVSSTQQPTNLENVFYSLATCAAIALVTLLFHAAHRWMLFSWGALIATHLTYIFFYLRQPEGLQLSPEAYFWISNGFLTACFILFSLACILDARKTGEYRRGVAPMSGVNSAVFLTITFWTVRSIYPHEQWMFRLGAAGLMLLFAAVSELTGPRKNYLSQIFTAKAVIMLTLALQAALSGEKLLVALAVECLALGFSYKRSGIVLFKAFGVLLLLITFTGCIASLKMAGSVHLGRLDMPANWFSALGVVGVFQIVAWFYEKFVRRLAPEARTTRGQWFLADTMLDISNASLSVIHAAAAALILLTITILEQGDNVMLPFLLAGEGLVMAGVGLLLFTPQIEVGSVLLLTAAHVCYYIFLWFPPQGIAGFGDQDHFALYTVFLAGFTYLGAYAWERYLRRYFLEAQKWEHHIIASLPYLAPTCMLALLIDRLEQDVYVPTMQGGLGMGLLLIGCLTRVNGVKASGVLGLALGGLSFYYGVYQTDTVLSSDRFLYAFVPFLANFAVSERLLAVLQRQQRAPSRLEDTLRSALVAAMVVFGVVGFYLWCPKHVLALYLLGLAVAMITLGAVFRESRYRWAALILFAMVILNAFAMFKQLSQVYRVLTFGASAIVLLVVSWAYSRDRHRRASTDSSAQDGMDSRLRGNDGNGGGGKGRGEDGGNSGGGKPGHYEPIALSAPAPQSSKDEKHG